MEHEVKMSSSSLSLGIMVAISYCAYAAAMRIIPAMRDLFIKARLFGRDLNKTSSDEVPEAMGMIVGTAFLISKYSYMGLASFTHSVFDIRLVESIHDERALLAVCSMLLLGFADDVLNLRWRHKLLLPTLASLPLLTRYSGSTFVVMPKPVRFLFGLDILNLSFLYYLYMGMLAVFCTNAINILAGINGLEAGQTFVMSLSLLAFNFIEISLGHAIEQHVFSIFLILPFTAVTFALLRHNWYPSRVFVGDTFCYFAGMTFAVAGILGSFSKTLLLFFIPQVINFLYSLPQLFHVVPCPRHRLPKFNKSTGLLGMSFAEFPKDKLSTLGRWTIIVLRQFRLAHVEDIDDGESIRINNLTIINFALKLLGPTHEERLTFIMLGVQVVGSLLAFTIRYPLAWLFYDQ